MLESLRILLKIEAVDLDAYQLLLAFTPHNPRLSLQMVVR